MMMRTLLVVAAALSLSLAGCAKKAEQTEPAKTEPAVKIEPARTEPVKVEPKKEAPKPAAVNEEGKGEAKASSPEENCGALYDFTKQLTEAFAKKVGGPSKATKPLPPKEKFIEACKVLPPEVSRCMNPQVAMREAAKCQEVMKNADRSKLEKFKQMLGGK